MSTVNQKLTCALIDIIENAPEDKQEALYDALLPILRRVRRQPIATMLLEAIEEGLAEVAIAREMEAETKPQSKRRLEEAIEAANARWTRKEFGR